MISNRITNWLSKNNTEIEDAPIYHKYLVNIWFDEQLYKISTRQLFEKLCILYSTNNAPKDSPDRFIIGNTSIVVSKKIDETIKKVFIRCFFIWPSIYVRILSLLGLKFNWENSDSILTRLNLKKDIPLTHDEWGILLEHCNNQSKIKDNIWDGESPFTVQIVKN